MKYIFLIIVVVSFQSSFGRSNAINKKKGKRMYGYLNFVLEYQYGNFIQYSKGDIAIRTIKGLRGAAFTIKCRVKDTKLSYDLGAFIRTTALDAATYNRSLISLYTQTGYTTSGGAGADPDLDNIFIWGLAPSVGRIINFKKFRLEPFFKFNFSFITYDFNSSVSVKNNMTNEYIDYDIGQRPNKLMFVPAAGFRTALKVLPLISLCGGFEVGYATGKHYFLSSHKNQQGKYQRQEVSVSAPQMYLLGGFGILIRPFNNVRAREYEKWNEKQLKRFDKYL